MFDVCHFLIEYLSNNKCLIIIVIPAMADDSRSDHDDDSSPSPPTWADLPSTSGGLRRSPDHQRRYPPAPDTDSDDLSLPEDHMGHPGDQLSHSATNHNVLFGRRPSPPANSNPNGRTQVHQYQQPQYHQQYHPDGASTSHDGYRSHQHHNGSISNSSIGGRATVRSAISNRAYQPADDDDGVIGYGFQGAGIGGTLAPIADLSPVQTTTLL